MTNRDTENPFQSPAESETQLRRPFSAELFCGVAVALFAFCGALLWVQLGVGIFALLLVVPGLLRGFIQLRRRVGVTEQRMGTFTQILFSIFLMVPVIFAASIGFGITCYAAATVVDRIPGLSIHSDFSTIILSIFGPALGVGAITFGLLFWLTLMDRPASRKAKKDDEPTS